MTLPTYFIIRHKATGRIMGQNRIRGSTYWEPVDEPQQPPRLFLSALSAQRSVIQWTRGNCKARIEHTFGFAEQPEYEISGTEYTLVPGRAKGDLEVVQATITLQPPRG